MDLEDQFSGNCKKVSKNSSAHTHFSCRLSWFAVYSIMVMVVSVIGTFIMHFLILDNSNFLLLLVLILEFGLSMIMFAFIMTTLFSKAKVAAGVGGLVSVMSACFFYIQVFAKGMPVSVLWIMSLLSQPAFAMAIDRVRKLTKFVFGGFGRKGQVI